ncbi:hypothetical protein [Neobacillus endophyticus]|uniref:hypothetical protein n=1 Tax=Neobacillus endophyticus TaxID=2738405 RepID=UPI001FE9A695|nr:hypothetical protein [Neobacillus endophyticus]
MKLESRKDSFDQLYFKNEVKNMIHVREAHPFEMEIIQQKRVNAYQEYANILP